MERIAEVNAKLAMVAQLLAKQKLDGVLLSRRDNFAWLTAGGDSHVASNEETGAATLLVTPTSITLLTTNIEEPRFVAEELVGTCIKAQSWPWYLNKADEIRSIITGRTFGSDNGIAGTKNVSAAFADLRKSLFPSEVERYRTLGKDATLALESAVRNVKPGLTEHAISAMLANELMSRGIEPTVNLVAADNRIRHFRHPIPTNNVLQRHIMVVMCARRAGLVVAATRLAHFGPLPEELKLKHEAICKIETAMYEATKPGHPMGGALAAGVEAYAQYGYANEWKLHHQGGPTGYKNRESIVSPGMQDPVCENQPFAWNPSITGTKGEDTILITANGYEVVTVGDGNWPMLTVTHNGKTMSRPDVLIL